MEATILVFPLKRRVGKIRDVAAKMLAKTTDRHAEFYRNQVTEALWLQMERVGVPESERHVQLRGFWQCVQADILRRCRHGSSPGGNAA